MFDSDEVQRAILEIDRAGETLSKEAWIDLCEEVSAYFDSAAQAARDELRADATS